MSESAVEDESDSRLVLIQLGKIGDVTQVQQLRELSSEEVEQFELANQLVRGIAFRAPYHRLRAANERYAEALEVALSEANESVRARRERCLDALRELFESVDSHASAWEEFVTDTAPSRLGEELADALAAHRADPSTATARDICSSRDFELELGGERGERVLVRDPQSGSAIEIASWQHAVERAAVVLLNEVARILSSDLADASKFLLALWAEALGGDAVVAPPLGSPEQALQLKFTPVDVNAVRAANSIVWQAGMIAAQVANGSDDDPNPNIDTPSASFGSGTSDTGADEPGGEDEVRVDVDEAKATSREGSDIEPLPLLAANLHQVVDAMLSNLNGLASQWAQRFPAEEFAQAIEIERAQAGSLMASVQRAVHDESEALLAAGYEATLPAYPPTLAQVAAWTSGAAPAELWTYKSTASVQAVHRYLQALGEVGKPAKFSFRNGVVETLEFSPVQTAKLYANARLLAELTEDTAATAALLVADGESHVGTPTHNSDAQQLHRAIRTCQDLGLPEAQLLYELRLLSIADSATGSGVEDVMDAARREVDRYVHGRAFARGVSCAMGDSLLPACDAVLQALVGQNAPELNDAAEPPASWTDG